jgi:hypothetical protein
MTMTTPPHTPSKANGYGNLYTPHAGAMIIQMQREGGLQSRTILLTPRQVRLLRICTSRTGKFVGACLAAALLLVAVEAIRAPILASRMSRLEYASARLDTLERSLFELQRRYDQVERMLGAMPGPTLAPATTTSPAPEPVGAAQPVRQSNVPDARGKSSVPMK